MYKTKFLPIIFFISLLIWSFALAYPINPDYDLWARLIAGMSIIENKFILKSDFYSYTQTHIWLDHEWGASAIIYWWSTLSDFFGKTKLETLAILKSLLVFAIFAISTLCVYIKRPKHSEPFQILYFSLAALGANIVFAQTIRCHMFTFLFYTILLTLLEAFRIKQRTYYLFPIPLLVLLWANIHGGCLSGLGLLVIYCIGEYLNKKEIKPYLTTLFVSFASLFINPYGFEYVNFLFFAGTMNREWISEWQSPFNTFFFAIKFKIFLIFMTLIVFLNIKRNKIDLKNTDKTKIIILLTTVILSVMHTKMIPFFVISASIFLFDDVYNVLNKAKILKVFLAPYNKTIYFLLIFFSVLTIKSGEILKLSIINDMFYPYSAVEYIKQNKIDGNLYVDMTYGSYCAYKLYPQNKIFIDGRYEEVYNPNLLNITKNFERNEGKQPEAVIKKYPTDIVLYRKQNFSIHRQDSLVPKIMNSNGWKKIYNDEWWTIYVRPDYPIKENKTLKYETEKYYNKLFETSITPEILKQLKK